MIQTKLLPEYCYQANRIIQPEGMVVHFISVDVGNPALNPDLQESSRFDIDDIWCMLIEGNRPGAERGRIWNITSDKRMHMSYHYLISQAGDEYLLAPVDRRVFHAGYSRWKGRDDCNSWTLGAALVGPPFTDAQYDALVRIAKRHKLQDATGHENVRAEWKSEYPEIASERRVPDKHDPGPDFDWQLYWNKYRQA